MSLFVGEKGDLSVVEGLELGRRARQLRLDTLVRLRWLAVAGQAAAVFATDYGLHFTLPIEFCLAVIAMSIWLNIGLRLRYPINHRLSDGAAFWLLTYDVLQLSALLYLTGGLENPFSILFLAPVMASAVSLPPRRTLWLVIVMICAASFLALNHLKLPWTPGESISIPIVYVAGIWTSLVLGAAFTAVYASRVAGEARQLSDALAATELVLAREQHLTQLDGLAAAAAHELGTPLATITVAIKELSAATPPDGVGADDVRLIAQEVGRCRAILTKLTSLGEDSDGMLNQLGVEQLIEEVVAPQRHFGATVVTRAAGEGPAPICTRNPGMVYGLGNLVENAIDFASSEVRILAGWTGSHVSIVIEDDGPGFSPDVINRLGEPYVTTRSESRAAGVEDSFGLGLGLFIAKTLLERSSATLQFANAAPPENGARIKINWPREAFERRPERKDSLIA